jgi:Na+-transporting NADH:ubiquinone oxidoreductase subunit NqrB
MNEIKQKLLLQSSPHIASPINSKMMMAMVLIALSPVAIFAVIVFGLQALLVDLRGGSLPPRYSLAQLMCGVLRSKTLCNP